jgi:hypothetical protein
MQNSPYLMAQIIHSEEPKNKIIDIIKQKARNFKNVKTSIIDSNTDPKIFIEFTTLDSMKQAYSNDNKNVEAFFQLMQDKKEDFTNIFDFQKDFSPQNVEKSDPSEIEDENLYLILKYKTNAKKIMREKYNFVFKIINILGIKASYEEVDDGFILFYSTKDDFELTQMDLNNLTDVRKWLEKKNVWKASFGKIFNDMH